MSKGLKELKEIELKWQYGVFTFVPNFEIIEKELKALEIIKNKPNIEIVNIINSKDYETYIENEKLFCADNDIEYKEETMATQEEYDLLKEVLL